MKTTILDKFQKHEKWAWLFIVLAFGSFFFWNRYFVTCDGPAHLYNGTLMFELWFGSNETAAQYLEFNPVPVPNWTGHLVLGFLNLMLPAGIAEKVFLLLYFVAFCSAFRYMVNAFNASNGFFSLVILPFAINQFIHAGFYNFCIAFIFLFLAVGFLVRKRGRLKFSHAVLLTMLLLLIYFSHLTVAVFAVFMMALVVAMPVFIKSEDAISVRIKNALRQGLFVLGCCIPLMLLVLYYMSFHNKKGELQYLSNEELWQMIMDMTPLVGHGPAEHPGTLVYLCVLVLLLLYVAMSKFFKREDRWQIKAEDAFFVAAAVLIAGYFILPDSDQNGGYISIRILFIFYLVMFARMAMISFPRWVKSLAIVAVLAGFGFQLYIRQGGQRAMSKWAKMMVQAGEKIEPGSVVLPVNCGIVWLSSHLSNYLGAEKPLVILENYEAHHIYFPLQFKKETPVKSPLSIHPDVVSQEFFSQMDVLPVLPDYILFYGFFEVPMPAGYGLNDSVSYLSGYENIHTTDFCQLYRLKNF